MVGIYVASLIYEALLSSAEIASFRTERAGFVDLRSHQLAEPSPDFSSWSDKRIAAYRDSAVSHFSPAVAILRIPRIHLEAPVLEGTDDLTLNRGVGRIVGTAAPGESGNIGIAGHRDSFFRKLKDITIGDSIELVTRKNSIIYVVNRVSIVDPSDTSVLGSHSNSLTLVTCYPFYFIGSAPQRYIVQASTRNLDRPVPPMVAIAHGPSPSTVESFGPQRLTPSESLTKENIQ